MRNLVLALVTSIVVVNCSSSIPKFDRERAFSYLQQQCDLGPRYPGSEEIELCRDWIIDVLKDCNAENIKVQEFSAEIKKEHITGKNIIASFYPQMSRRILLGAHYDTRPWADKDADPQNHNTPIIGANDAASGVAVLLEIAQNISQTQPAQFGIDLVFFDLEDMGEYGDNSTWCLGSTHFAENFSGPKPEKAIVVDMIGDNDLDLHIEYSSYHNSPNLVKEVWDLGRELGFSEFHYKINNKIYDDHIPLIMKGFNAIVVIDMDYPFWHTIDDTPDKCSQNSLFVVGQTLLNLIYE